MKSILLTSTIMLSLTITPLSASPVHDDSSINNAEQGLGFGTGAVAGGLVAGPIGMITGALVGSLIGQNIADEKRVDQLTSARDELNQHLDTTASQLESVQQENSNQSAVLLNAHRTIERLLIQNNELKNHALNFDVQFRTNSIQIEKKYQSSLDDLVDAIKNTSHLEIEVAGYADRIGDEEYNMELSDKRASEVKDYLVNKGLEANRITTLAHGESLPLHSEENLDNNFFDRRVTVLIRPIELSAENIANEINSLENKLSIAANEK